MEINFVLKQEDLIQFSRQFSKNQSSHKIIAGFLSVMFVTFVFADLIYLLFSGSGNFGSVEEIFISILIRSMICLGIIGIFYRFALFMQQKATDKIDSVQNNGILCEHKIVFDQNEFIEITDVNTTKHSWLSIGEIKELDDFVLINVNFVGTHFIPKRYFNDQTHINEFVETARYYQTSAKNNFNTSHLASFERESNALRDGNK